MSSTNTYTMLDQDGTRVQIETSSDFPEPVWRWPGELGWRAGDLPHWLEELPEDDEG